MKKVVLLVLPLLVAAVSCASAPSHNGEPYAGVPRNAYPEYSPGAEGFLDGDLLYVDLSGDAFIPGDSLEGGLPSGDLTDDVFLSGDSPESGFPSGDLTGDAFLSEDSPDGGFPHGVGGFSGGVLLAGDLPGGVFLSMDSPEDVLPSGDSFSGDFPDGALLSGDLTGGAFPSGNSPEGVFPSGDPLLGDVPGNASATVLGEAYVFSEAVIAETPSPESGLIIAVLPGSAPARETPTGWIANPAPVSQAPPVTATPPATVPAWEAASGEVPVEEPYGPASPPEEPPVVMAPSWAFAPDLPNPVSDFRNLLPPPVVFSRVVYVTEGQAVEIPFRGSGWIFLGETGGQRGISFDARRPDSEGQTFVFRAEAEGEYALRFYRRDFIRDIILNDHVRVIIADTDSVGLPVRPGRVVAERWPSPIDQARVLRAAGRLPLADTESGPSGDPPRVVAPEPTPEAVAMTVPATPAEVQPQPAAPPAVPQPPAPAVAAPVAPPAPVIAPAAFAETIVDPAPFVIGYPFELLQMAREEFDAGRVAEAIDLIDLFRELHPSGSDEAWWLLGQFFEADSPSRNILNAISYYRRLVSEFPQSSRLTDARRRIAFLERFFINIR
ncbi:MAG: hypothetical protein FWB79_05625 [Treponema sp.]|nr:hypothetical protein [Treponema sp.]